MATALANKARFCLAKGKIDFSSDSFKAVLMDTGFTFNKDTHHAYADISAGELATGNGYTQDTKTLSGVTVTENDTTDLCEVTWSNVTWAASGGSIGPTPGMIIYDDTVAVDGDVPADPIIGYIDFGSEITQADGGTLTISSLDVDI